MVTQGQDMCIVLLINPLLLPSLINTLVEVSIIWPVFTIHASSLYIIYMQSKMVWVNKYRCYTYKYISMCSKQHNLVEDKLFWSLWQAHNKSEYDFERYMKGQEQGGGGEGDNNLSICQVGSLHGSVLHFLVVQFWGFQTFQPRTS